MSSALLVSLGREALLLMVLASLPPLAASFFAGFLASLFQATTQIQEATLSVVPRLCAAVGALVLAGPWIGQQLTRFTARLMYTLAQVAW